MRPELQLLLDQSGDYQDPLEWAKNWSKAAEMVQAPCWKSGAVVTWHAWYRSIYDWCTDRHGMAVGIVKASALSALSRPGPRFFAASVRYDAWYQHDWGANYRAMVQELIDIHFDHNLGHALFESYDQWFAVLMESAPHRIVSL